MIDEISDNLSEYKTIRDKERYIHSLIVPFRELSELLYPEKTHKQRIQNELNELQKDREYWEQLTNKDFNDFEINGKKLTNKEANKEVKKQLKAIEKFTNERNATYKRLEIIRDRYWQLLNEPTDEVEKSLSAFHSVMCMFANRLDALLLKNSIDLLRLQNECGTYLKTHRTITDVGYYTGSLELAQKYIAELPKENAPITPIQNANNTDTTDTAKPQQIIIPDNILQELEKTGYIENAAARPLKWCKSKLLLAYFVDVANDKLHLKHGNKRKIKQFETLFGVSGLGHCINEYKNKTGQNPVGYKIIDKIKF